MSEGKTIFLSAFLVLALQVSGAHADETAVVDARLAWDGVVRPDTPTEILLSVRSARDEEFSTEIDVGNAKLRFNGRVSSASSPSFQLPLPPLRKGVLTLATRFPQSGELSSRLEARLVPKKTPVVAIVARSYQQFEGNGEIHTIYPRIESLPHFPASYRTVDAIVLDMDLLASLSSPQINALNTFISSCGRLIGVNTTAAMRTKIAADAGCQGKFVNFPSPDDSVLTPVHDLLEIRQPSHISANALQSLLPATLPSAARPIFWFFCAYFLVIILLVLSRRTIGLESVALPLIASALVLLAWKTDRVEQRLVSWAEFPSDSHYGQFAALVEVIGSGKGETQLRFPAHMGPPNISEHGSITYSHEPDQTLSQTIFLETALFSQDVFYAQGALEKTFDLDLALQDDRVVISNHGITMSAPSLLAWRDSKYAVPSLAPGASWRPDTDGEPWSGQNIEKVFRERALPYQAALLMSDTLFMDAPTNEAGPGNYFMVQL